MGIKAFSKIRVFIPIILSLFFIIINPDGLKDILRRFIIPFQLIGVKIKASGMHLNSAMKDNIMLRTENERLRKKILLQLSRYAKLDEVFLENQRLREILAFKEKAQFSFLVANIISLDPSPHSSTIIIDRGRKDGIKKGSWVISLFKGKEVVVIGRVHNTFSSSSLVLLTTDPQFLIPGRLKNTREKGLLVGLKDKMELKFIERQTPVAIGEPVITVADSLTPQDIIIGYVKDVSHTSGLFKKVFVKPACSFSKLEEVLVLVP